MTGLEMPLPVLICETPGCLVMASMMFEAEMVCSSCAETTLTGAGIWLICVVPVSPVTTTSCKCTHVSCSFCANTVIAEKSSKIVSFIAFILK